MSRIALKKSAAKDKIIKTALRLFNQQGVHHTGNEQIITESGISKMTFYNHFPTKAKLIAEYLRLMDARWFALLEKHITKTGLSSHNKILAIFDALEEWFSDPDFYGCPFIRGLSDFDETDDKEVTVCVGQHFEKTGNLILSLLKESQIKNPESLVPPLLSLVAGAIVVSHATQSPAPSKVNRHTANLILKNAEEN